MSESAIAEMVVRDDEGDVLARFDEEAVHALRAALAFKIDAKDFGPDTAHARLLASFDEVLQ